MALGFLKRKNTEEKAEMSFIDHLEELRSHLFRSAIAIAIGAIVVAVKYKFFTQDILMGPTHNDFPTYKFLCNVGHTIGLGDKMCMGEIPVKMQNTVMSGQISLLFTVIFVGGLIIAFPFVFREFWKFVKPALTKKELQKTRGVIFWVSFLFFLGVAFGYFFIAPYTVNFFANFTIDDTIENRWTITSYLDTMIPLILGTGLAFQMPLVIYFLAKIGIVTGKFLREYRRYAIVVILIVAAVITPPDIISQIIVTIPLWALYEISISLASKVEKEKAKEEEWS
jgi:sec-independent protein translocase protein TatC